MSKVPSYRLHRGSGQAIVTISRRDFYLGRHNTPDSRRRYNRLIAEYLSSPRNILSLKFQKIRLRHLRADSCVPRVR